MELQIINPLFDALPMVLPFGVDSTAMSKKRKQRERQRELDRINDDDLKRELAKGHTLISYFEYQTQ